MKRLLFVLLLAVACDQKDDGAADAAAAALSAILPPLPTAAPSSSTEAIAPRDAGSDAKAGACDGGDCPLQGWMKQIWPHMKSNDYEGTARLLEECAKLAPPNAKTAYPNWVSISLDGANAARAADMEAVKASCRGCHQQYEDKYRAEMRARPLP